MEIEPIERPFIIEKNLGGGSGYSITENPGTEYEIVRSPFDSEEQARQRELEIAESWGFKAVEVKNRACGCPTGYHTMFENCRTY